MAKPNKPFDNKYHYDAGRLRHSIAIMQDVVTDNGSGGSNISKEQVLQTWAGKEAVSDYKIANRIGDSTNYDKFQYFVIRNRSGFTPIKTMYVSFGAHIYSILEVKENDDPCTFLWLLCAVSI